VRQGEDLVTPIHGEAGADLWRGVARLQLSENAKYAAPHGQVEDLRHR
jgi:hypothetical protein